MGLGGTRGRGRVGDGASGATRTRVRMQRKGSKRRGEADLQAQNLGRGKGGRKWFKETSVSSLAAPRAGSSTCWKQPRSLYNQQYRSREHRSCFFRRVRSSAVPKQPGGTVAAGLGPRRPSPDFRMGSVLQDVLPRQLLAPAGWWHASCPSFVPRCHSSWDPTGARCPWVRGPELLLARCQQTPGPWGKQGMGQQGPSLPRCDSRVPSSPSPLN